MRKTKYIEVVIIPSTTRDGMRKAYDVTARGKKAVPYFAKMRETERKILDMAR